MMVFQTFSSSGEEEMKVPDDIDFHQREILKNPAWPKMYFIPPRLACDPTNWWVPNHQGILSLLEGCGMKVKLLRDTETYINPKNPDRTSIAGCWTASEFLSASGKERNTCAI